MHIAVIAALCALGPALPAIDLHQQPYSIISMISYQQFASIARVHNAAGITEGGERGRAFDEALTAAPTERADCAWVTQRP